MMTRATLLCIWIVASTVLLVSCNSDFKNTLAFTGLELETSESTPCEILEPRPQKSNSGDIQQLVESVEQILNSLSPEQAESVRYCVGDPEQSSWTNVPGRRSSGVALGSLSKMQQDHVWDLLDALLSRSGYEKVRFIATDIEEASGAGTVKDYTFVTFGSPDQDAVWGVQLDGHHLGLNFLVYGDHVTLAPSFIGTQPLQVDGRHSMNEEVYLGRELYGALSTEQQSLAYLPDQVRRDVFAGSGPGQRDRGRTYDFTRFDGFGIALSDFSEDQRKIVETLIHNYVHYLDPVFALVTFKFIVSEIENGFFAYSTRGDRAYYRVYIPNVALIEYSDVASNHIHTIFRLLGDTPFRDYGGLATVRQDQRSISHHYLYAEHHQ